MAHTILVVLDGSEHAEKALDIAITLAKNSNSELLALNVVSDAPLSEGERRLAESEYGSEIPGAVTGTERSSDAMGVAALGSLATVDRKLAVRRTLAEQIVNQAAQEARSRGVDEVGTAVERGDPATVILRQARRVQSEMIVLGSRGLSDIQGLLLGSVSHKVAHRAPCSVVTVT
jgi:nucleotide-binding universal stress UspA family protein